MIDVVQNIDQCTSLTNWDYLMLMYYKMLVSGSGISNISRVYLSCILNCYGLTPKCL